MPRAYYVIDAEGHASAPVPLRRLRRSVGPYPAYSGADANANANANAYSGGGGQYSWIFNSMYYNYITIITDFCRLNMNDLQNY